MLSRTCSSTDRLLQSNGRLRSSAGFTLTELIVVIVMIGALAATVSVTYGPLASSVGLRTAVDQVAGDLRFLQSCAMASYNSTGGQCASRSGTFPTGQRTYNLGGQIKSLPPGVTISSGATVTFNSLGEYASTTDTTLTFKYGNATSSVKIYAVSGDVEAY